MDLSEASPETLTDTDDSSVESLDLSPEELEEAAEANLDAEPVAYSGTDFDVRGLVRRLEEKEILIPTFGHDDESIETAGFQRGFVWSRPQMDRFIESLMLGYPIPGILLVQQKDRRYLVLDGQQRLRTLGAYYANNHGGKPFSLQNVASRFKDLTYPSLPEEMRRALDNTFVQAIIVRTDGSEESFDAIYQIFERLNTGGTQLTPHEIRVALFAGRFIDYIADLNTMTAWRKLYGPLSPRLRDQELVLRFIALYLEPDEYARPLKKYLNDFVGRYRDLATFPSDKMRGLFEAATELVLQGPGRGALRGVRQLNAALTEAVLVGLARRLDQGGAVPRPGDVTKALESLAKKKNFVAAVSQSTADEGSLRDRLRLAAEAFSKI
jgi:Protein of unknown function DUF262